MAPDIPYRPRFLIWSEFASEHPGYCGAQDTFYVGNLKGVGRVYQQTFIDTYLRDARCGRSPPETKVLT